MSSASGGSSPAPTDDDIEAAAIAPAEADVTSGRLFSHDDVKPWLEKLAKGDFVPFDLDNCE